jgi:iron complex outermembrane recepter protein
MEFFSTGGRLSAAMAFIALLSTNAVADEQVAGAHLEEIIVTATKRGNADVQSVPISISAYSGEQLEALGIENLKSIDLKTPGLVLNQNSGSVQPYIRGIGADFPEVGLEPPVSAYVDDVYWQRATSSNYDLIDLSTLEVLKGPQGTLYGRNATGGAILLNTNNPTNKDDGSVSLEAGNLNHKRADLILNYAISDRIAARLAARYNDQAGYVDNPVSGIDYGGFQSKVIRGKISYTGDAFSVLVSAGYAEEKNRSGLRQAERGIGVPLCTVCAITGASAPPGDYETYQGEGAPGPGGSHVADASVRVTAEIGQLTFTSISAARDASSHNGTDETGFASAPPPFALDLESANVNKNTGTDLLQEFRIVSHFSGPLNFLAGVNGQYSDERLNFQVTGVGVAALPDDVFQTGTSLYTYSVSPYGELYYDITSAFKLTVGGRFNSDRKDASTLVETGAFGPAYRYDDKWTNFTPRAILAYSPDSTQNYYLSYSTGFKSGGFNLPSFAQSTTDFLSPEKIKSYEVGAKNKFLNDRVQTSAAIFYYDYKEIQVGHVDAIKGEVKENAGAAQAYGVELDAQFAATDQIVLGGGYAFLHARFTSYPAASVWVPNPAGVGFVAGSINLDGSPLTRAPDHTVYASATYKFPISATWKGSVSGLTRYTSPYDFNADRGGALGLDYQRAYAVSNFSGFIGPDNDRIVIGFYVNNAFDKLYYQFVNTGALGTYRGPSLPRTFGGNVTVKF